MFIDDLTSPELQALDPRGRTIALVPIGGTEQNGPHMVLGKHNVRVKALAEKIARALGNALVAPVIAYVPEGGVDPPTSHMRFAGTITVPAATFESVLEYAARSLRASGFRDIVLLGDHGGYQRNEAGRGAAPQSRMVGAHVRVHALAEYYRATDTQYRASAESARLSPTPRSARMPGSPTRRWRWPSIPRSVRGAQLRGRIVARRGARRVRRSAPRKRPSSAPIGVDAHRRESVAAITRACAAALNTLFNPSCHRNSNRHALLARSPVALRCSALVAAVRAQPATSIAHRLGCAQAAPAGRASPRCPACRRSSTPPTCTAKRGGQAERRGRAATLPRVYVPQRPVERRLRDRSGDAEGRRPVQGRHQSAARRSVVGSDARCGSRTTPKAAPTAASRRSTRRPASPASRFAVDDPYNMYFTPDGKSAIVVAEAHKRLDFRDPQTMALQSSLADAATAAASTMPISRSTAATRSSRASSRRQPREDRSRRPQGRRLPQAVEGRHAAGHPRLARTARCSSSPT